MHFEELRIWWFLNLNNMINHEVTSLVPEMQQKVHDFFADARSQWLYVYIFEALRSKERQYQLFGQWRTAWELVRYWVPAKYAKPWSKPVTWTLKSKHLEGKAIDVVFDISNDPKNFTKDWSLKVPSWSGDYAKLIKISKKYGLTSLSPVETCHFQI